jgi:ABC-2 type transport system ATP-binding protein
MLLPDYGRVLVGGADSRFEEQRVRRQVGFAIAGERSFFPRLSARENLEFFAAMDEVPPRLRAERIEVLLERTGLGNAGDTLVTKFSAGMYQRLGIARALMKQPCILLLDEPTRSLDPPSAQRFWTLVRSLAADGATVVIATHSFREAATVGDRVAILQQGKLSADCRIGRMDAEELCELYLQTTGEINEDFALVAGVAP